MGRRRRVLRSCRFSLFLNPDAARCFKSKESLKFRKRDLPAVALRKRTCRDLQLCSAFSGCRPGITLCLSSCVCEHNRL